MITTVTSNGMLLDERRLARLQGRADLLAISLDGPPASHNRMRGSERAFDTMHGRLAGVRRSGIPFGFIFTLTQHNLEDLEWVARFALEEKARLLQIHPLEEVGFAAVRLPGSEPDATVATWAYLQAARIQAMAGQSLYVQVDLSHREFLRTHPERIFADEERAVPDGLPLADLVSPVVIEADGTVVPVQHGFPRAYALGSLYEDRLTQLGAQWRQETYHRFRALCRQVYADVTASSPLPMFIWYSGLASGARAATTVS